MKKTDTITKEGNAFCNFNNGYRQGRNDGIEYAIQQLKILKSDLQKNDSV
jgi:hypothetical protein